MSTTVYNYKLLVCNYGNACHGTHQWNSKKGNPDRGRSLLKPHPQIFRPTNTIQVWGHPQYELIDLVEFGYFEAIPDLLYHTFDVRDKFKEWYNHTFPHTFNCPQLIEHFDIDGRACTCIHRPYKSFDQNWSLTRAIAYTFNELVDLQHNQLCECFAISKLAYAVRQQWNVNDLESFNTMLQTRHHYFFFLLFFFLSLFNKYSSFLDYSKIYYNMIYYYTYFFCILCARIFSIIYQQIRNVGKKLLKKYQLKRNTLHIATFQHQDIKSLFVFQALKYHNTYSIDCYTTDEVLNRLIQEAQKSKLFTLLFQYHSQTNIKSMHIEFIQDRYSYIVSIPLTVPLPIAVQEKIHQMYHQIFLPKNTHQLWGPSIDYELMDYIKRHHLRLNAVDIQKKFKKWYNGVFPHEFTCAQVSINKNIDGNACTCIFRPYKSVSDQWSLLRAIDFTFHIINDVPVNEIQQCLAITQLALMIRQNWDFYELEIYQSIQFGPCDIAN